MPNRWIKEAYCTSPRIAAVGPEARDLWVRLLVNADDHGYFHGSAQLVASMCFPLQPNARKCEQLLSELASALLIVRYEAGGKDYLAITQWYERPRSQPKFPTCPEGLLATANNCAQLQTVASLHDHDHDHDHDIKPDEEGWAGVTESDLSKWTKAYPAVDIHGELAKALAWAFANPKKRKANWRRFLVGWLSRQQEKPKPVMSRSEQRAANMDEITGRSRRERTVTDAMGGAPVLPAILYVREQDDGNVG